MGIIVKSAPRYSYSRLNTYANCGWRYKLTYEDKHYIQDDNLSNELGTLVHHIYETIALKIMAGEKPDYEELKKDFLDINIPKTSPTDVNGGIFGINILKEKYREAFYEMNEHGESYFTKCSWFLEKGIYRLENYLNEHPNLELYSVEQFFSVEYNGFTLSGYIDRILHDKDTDEYIIVDIKTKDHPFKDTELTTPLQFVVYSIALKSILHLKDYPTRCVYDLPFCDMEQIAGTKGFINRGLKKLDKIFEGIKNKAFAPNPTPLCYWCPFSYTNPNQHEEAKHLCCYYSLWKPNGTAKAWETMNKWEGIDKHDIIMEKFESEQQGPGKNKYDFDFDF